MSQELIQLIGFLPAIIFPLASISQLWAIYHQQSAKGVSITTWIMVAIANISLFVYTQKYDEVQSILALLGAGLLNVCVVFLALHFRRRGL